jgi:lipid-binding SYLF domain-containing protein
MISRLALPALLLVAVAAAAPAHAQSDQQKLVDKARFTVEEMRHDSEFTYSADLLRRAKAVMVVPELTKGGLIVGGQGGGGVLLAKTSRGGWSYPAFYSIGGATLGFQVGVQQAEVIFFVMTDRAMQAWLRNEFKLGTQDGVAVFVVGKEKGPNPESSTGADAIAWVKATGAYAGITVEGTSVSFNTDDNRKYYDKTLNADEIVLRGEAANPGAEPLRNALAFH